MRKHLLWAALAAVLVLAPPALAQKRPMRRAASVMVGRVERKAASLPVASTPTQAAADQTALQPMVDQGVQEGRAAVSALLNSGNPNVAADLLKDATTTAIDTTMIGNQTVATTVVSPPHGLPTMTQHIIKARAAGCYGTHDTRVTVGAAGVTFGWREVQENGWCGNGSTITSNNGASFTKYRAGPYCWNDESSNWSWDGSHAWLHGRNYGVLGGSYIWGCASLQTIQPVIRIAANGYYDHYNDY